ncbi:MAG: PKD domain-containing protein, partial [Flavobacteriales bacterium]|nr:PKD domain-containing protein [Flavobacteriales bacterium]
MTASATEVLVGEAVTFGSGTQPGALVTWDFGDGTTSTEEAPVHAYTLPGSYPVT